MSGVRASGRTTRQMQEAPEDSVFVWCMYGSLEYPRRLAARSNRTDLEIVGPSWLEDYRYVGRDLKGLIIDHALFDVIEVGSMKGEQLYYHIERAKTRVKP